MNFSHSQSLIAIFLIIFIPFCLPTLLHGQSDNEDPFQKYHSALEWREIGPYRGGRSCAVAGVPNKPNLFYFGATGGGVWKTEDGGRSWSNLSDGFFGGSIGSIAVAPSDHNVIYVGGGEKTVRGNVSSGNGAWRSEDAGKTWTFIGLEDSRHIARIRVHPTDYNTVYAASMGNLYKPNSERGIFKSTDGGTNWKKVLYVNDSVGFVDLCMDPGNPRILYASSWKVQRTPYSLSSGGKGSGIFKSTDSGDTWTELTNNEGLPKGVWGISGIAVSPVNGEKIYAIIENKDGGVFSSSDGGKTWKKVNSDRSLRQRAWYYTRIYADTRDENTVYVLNVSYHKSTDGGNTFSSFRAPHGDHHDLWIAPENPDRMIMGDDGGAQVTFDGGETWSTYHNQPTAQFYRVTTDNHTPYRIYAAQQDNSTVRIPHRTYGRSISEDDWTSTAGGESAHIAVDPENDDVVYGGSYGGFLTRVNHANDNIRAINVWPDNPMGYGAEGMKYRFQWNFPIFFSRHNPDKLYAASNHLHVTTDEGQSWQIISPDLTRNAPEKLKSSGGPITQDNTSVEYYCTIFAVNESPIQEGMIWAGSDDGLIHMTEDGGSNWTNVTPSNMPEWIMINAVEPSFHNPDVCYIAATMYKNGDFQPYLYKTKDKGKSWQKIVTGIDNEHFTRVIREDRVHKEILYAGTESGMYISYDEGSHWFPFQKNLPIVPVTDLAIKNNDLIVATQGRGLWIIDDLSLIHQSKGLENSKKDLLFTPEPGMRMPGSQSNNTQGAGTNHPGGVLTYFYIHEIDDKKDTIELTYKDSDGKIIETFSNKAKERSQKLEIKKGSNKFVWDMTYPSAKRFDGMIMWSGSLAGPRAIPGNYRVILTSPSGQDSATFEILKNPSQEGDIEDIRKQFEFIQSINDKVTEAHETIIEIRALKKQIMDYTSRIEDKEVKEMAGKIDSVMTAVEEALYQTKNRSGQDPLNYPIKLTNKLAAVNSLTQMGSGDYPPTEAAIKVRDELTEKIDEQLAIFEKVKVLDINMLNKLIMEKKLSTIIVETKK